MNQKNIDNKFNNNKFNNNFKHWSNIKNKESKQLNEQQKLFINECKKQYLEYDKCFDVNDFKKIAAAWNKYLTFVRENNKNKAGKDLFSSQSKFESSILEESMYRIFSKYIKSSIEAGSIKAYSNMYFSPSSFDEFIENTNFKFNVKDQDFALYKNIEVNINNIKKNTAVPIVAIECKTYLDKTMLEGSIATADKIKYGNPFCFFCIVTECYDVSVEVDINTTRIDQIYVLTKQKGRDKSAKIQEDVLEKLYQDISNHLNSSWSNVEEKIKKNGIVI